MEYCNYMVAEKTLYSKASRELCALLVDAREKAGYRQIDVAESIGLSQTELSKIENGQRRVEFITVCRLAKLYGSSLEEFIPSSLKLETDEV